MWPFDNIKKLMVGKMITKLVGSIVRHGIGWVTGALTLTQVPQFVELAAWLTSGVDPVSAAAVTGAGMIFPLVWSFWDKLKK